MGRFRVTTRRMMIAVACLGLCLAYVRSWGVGERTVYAEGYDETKFRSLKVGMSFAEIEAIMGPPLRRWEYERTVCYGYTDQLTCLSDYERRWILFDRGGKVNQIISEYWVD